MDVREEAERVVKLFGEQPASMVGFLSGQLGVLKTQAQTLTGLCGLTITVTGFSGHQMVRAGPLSAGAMVLGILLILVAIVITLRTLTRLRWVSQDLGDDLVKTAETVIERRNRQQARLSVAGGFVAAGLGCYLLSVVFAAFSNA